MKGITKDYLFLVLLAGIALPWNTDYSLSLIFDDSAVRAVLDDPSTALEKRDSLWNAHEGYRQTLTWHERNSVPLDFSFYESALRDMVSDNPALSGDKRYLETINRIQKIQRTRREAVDKHLSSYLPGDTSFVAYAYFVAFTEPYAFSLDDKLIVDIASPRWHGSPEYILNIVIHEVYHIGYEFYTPDDLALKPTTKEHFLQTVFADIQNEGMATYIAYKALDIIPSPYRDRDYQLLESEHNVVQAFEQINQIIELAETIPLDSIIEKAWAVGVVEDRAFYVAGAFMAQAIERERGKEYLVGLVRRGGRGFIEEYNNVAERKYKITL